MESGLSSILPLIPRKTQYPYSTKTAYQIQADFVEARESFYADFLMSSLVALRCSSINFHSSNLFRCLWATPQLSPRRSLIEGSEPRLFLLYCQFRLCITTALFRAAAKADASKARAPILKNYGGNYFEKATENRNHFNESHAGGCPYSPFRQKLWHCRRMFRDELLPISILPN